MEKKIYYHDTDCGGVVYYSNYLKYLEEARTEFLLDKGLDVDKLAKEDTLFVVGSVNISYKAPAKYADKLAIYTEVIKKKNVSLEFSQEVKRADQVLVSAITKLVCVGSNFKPKAMSKEVNERIG
ncbi:MAG: acyl-CoA thioesterase [Candidatus Omnitrophica bacterium]|nr:acyl-CoA thioesterase [Candidatus Omnitrophota bacterium]